LAVNPVALLSVFHPVGTFNNPAAPDADQATTFAIKPGLHSDGLEIRPWGTVLTGIHATSPEFKV
jgi:hypothetical protein